MCVIYVLQPGIMLPMEYIENSTWNNEHGYGIAIRNSKTKNIRVVKDCPKNGNDPTVIFKILKDNVKHQRIVHVRNRTEGEISLQNTQPISLMTTEDGVELFFAHNGTIHEYGDAYFRKTEIWGQHTIPEEFKDTSDSVRFAKWTLKPVLESLFGPVGQADYTTVGAQKILPKFWPTGVGNKGILFSNKLENFYFGEWKDIKIPDTELTFKASNDQYFTSLVRGTVFTQRQNEKREKEEAERASKFQEPHDRFSSQGSVRSDLTLISSMVFQERFKLKPLVQGHILEDYDIYTDEGKKALANLTAIEIEEICDKVGHSEVPYLILALTHMLHEEMVKKEKLEFEIKEYMNGDVNENAI